MRNASAVLKNFGRQPKGLFQHYLPEADILSRAARHATDMIYSV
jgi:hypothetical protein